ncbi:hypothetical protein [Archangium lansingense]|uniref:RNA polymerase sigma-70 region 2 domain-containing protein n=1 Tax=Archangium lansingense TaxID=2995310 RepID=A0ABT4A689_9BACT|nr:hypothetical protein [Archangium lansinium]MCY1076851.1 hypothetical protein [Archangium lansinium]
MSLSPEVVEVLVEHHRKFLDFLIPRVGTPEAAEELLQAAFVKGMRRVRQLPRAADVMPCRRGRQLR